jgi:cell wall-associated NlpC family hydrolase/lysophospholipase L1-like esterase
MTYLDSGLLTPAQRRQLAQQNTGGDRKSSAPSVTGDDLVNYAKKFQGVPYVVGGRSPSGWDCSGFTWFVANHFGISIGSTSEAQLHNGHEVFRAADLQPGDLIILRTNGKGGEGKYGHVMMYSHGGNVIHAHGGTGGTTNIQPKSVAIPSTHHVAGMRRLVGDFTTSTEPPKSVLVYGDSLTVGMEPYLSEYHVDGVGGRSTNAWGTGDGIEPLKARFKKGDFNKNWVVVVWLGTNDGNLSTFSNNITTLMNLAKSSGAYIRLGLVWHANSGSAKGVNDALRRIANAYGNVDVIDFPSVGKDHLGPDKIHCTPEGYQKCAQLIKDQVEYLDQSTSLGATAGPSSTTEPQDPGSFAAAKKYINPRKLREGAVFNPPQPNKKLFRLGNYPNPRGFIVRDPSIQKNFAGNSGWQSFETPYGFQFSFNPDSFTESYTAPSDGDPIRMMIDMAKGAPLLAANDMATVTFKLLLARFEDMRILKNENWAQHYPPNSITEAQRKAILKYGTQADIEYLFRLCNGEPQDTWRGKTSDWGMMLPTLSIVSLGDSPGARKIRGYITSIGYDHKVLIAGMIPVYTELAITFNRLVDSYYDTMGAETDLAIGANASVSGKDIKPSDTKDGKTANGDPDRVVTGARLWTGTIRSAQNTDKHPSVKDGLDDASFVWYAFNTTYPNALSGEFQGRAAMMKRGKRIHKQENMEPGDLVFLGTSSSAAPSHVGIYSGGGKILHMPKPETKGPKGPIEESIEEVATRLKLDKRPICVRRIMERNVQPEEEIAQ